MRGLVKATHYYSTRQAWSDFNALARIAIERGHEDLVQVPSMRAGHRTIDRYIKRLREALESADHPAAEDK
jgi:hypothetical protein